MRKQTCRNCGGSGHMMGGGMMPQDCNQPDCENGFVYISDSVESKPSQEKKAVKLDRRSKEYKNTIKELMKLGMSEEEAHKQFSSAEKDFNQEKVE